MNYHFKIKTMMHFDDYPVEIQEKMLENQMLQGNPRNLDVFRKDIYAGKDDGGFAWGESPEQQLPIDSLFWTYVLEEYEFDVFYKKYPKGYSNFVLPKAWHVVTTEENREMLSKWRFKGRFTLRIGDVVGNCGTEAKQHNPKNSDNRCFGIEITTNQFIRHVLEKESKAKTFPREMLCWNYKESAATPDMVYAIIPDRPNKYPIITSYSHWKHAKEINETPQLIYVTYEDISNGKGVGIDPSLLRLKE